MAEKYIEYTIQSGDTLWDLSQKYDTTVDELAKLNNIENPNLIYAGATLKIPVAQTEEEKAKEDEEAKKTAEAVAKLKAAKEAAEAKAAAEAKKVEEDAKKSIFEKIADKIKGDK